MSTTNVHIKGAATVGSRLSPRLHPKNLLDLHNQDIEHLVNGLQLGNLSGLLNWTKGNGLCATTVISTECCRRRQCVTVTVNVNVKRQSRRVVAVVNFGASSA